MTTPSRPAAAAAPTVGPPRSPPDRLFLIDGYALIYRAFFALISRPLTTSHGENTSAAWGVANFLKRLLARHHPEYLVWVHDSGRSFRSERYADYKATREKLTQELQADFDRGMLRISEILGAYHIPIVTLDGYEADDVIGSLARVGVERGLQVVIVSGDKDFQQLVRPAVWLLNPGRGGPAAVEEHWVGVGNAAERLGVEPARVTDYLALVGDTSDNVPGVPGIGEKTARELVAQFGSLDAMIAGSAAIARKRPREALQQHADRALLSRELVTIHQDLPVTLDLEDHRVGAPDQTRLRRLYVELEFHSLIGDADTGMAPESTEGAATSDGGLTPAPPPPVRHHVADTPESVARLIAAARRTGRVLVEACTVPEPGSPTAADPLRSTLVGLTMAMEPGEAWYLPFAHRSSEPEQAGFNLGVSERRKPAGGGSLAARAIDAGAPPPTNLPSLSGPELATLRNLLGDAAVGKVGHNVKASMLVLQRLGVPLQGIAFDTMIGSYVLDPGRRSHDLSLLALECLDRHVPAIEEVCGKGKSAIPFDEVPVPIAAGYAAERADAILRLHASFEPQLEAQALAPLLRDIELPLITVLAAMETVGVTIDLTWFHSLKERFQRERAEVEQAIHRVAGSEFNINSNPQLREVLFERLGLPVLKKTATGPSTDASVLQQLADEGHELPALLMEYRELAKLESTYLDALPALVNPRTGRLHTSFNQTVASTGRLSSSDPNLQNIPIRRELGRDIRRGFVPRDGWQFVAADYSQIELRLLAHLSGDQAFVDAFRAGGDIHRQTASLIFGVPLADVTGEMRARAKTINFATIYGQGPHALSRQLHIEFAEARDFIARYFERFAGIRKYLDSMVEFARTQGYVQTLFGRRRYIPELADRNYNIRAFGERTATNSPIQGSAADLIKVAMIRVAAALRAENFDAKMLLQVHDELVFEAPPREVDRVITLVTREMEQAASLTVPLVVDVGVGANWLETKVG